MKRLGYGIFDYRQEGDNVHSQHSPLSRGESESPPHPIPSSLATVSHKTVAGQTLAFNLPFFANGPWKRPRVGAGPQENTCVPFYSLGMPREERGEID